MPLAVQSTTEEKVGITVAPKTASGKPAPVDGGVTVTVLNGGATAANDPANPLRFFVISEDSAGSAQFRVEVDADLGPGTATISDIVDYTYVSPQATSLGFVADPAEPK